MFGEEIVTIEGSAGPVRLVLERYDDGSIYVIVMSADTTVARMAPNDDGLEKLEKFFIKSRKDRIKENIEI